MATSVDDDALRALLFHFLGGRNDHDDRAGGFLQMSEQLKRSLRDLLLRARHKLEEARENAANTDDQAYHSGRVHTLQTVLDLLDEEREVNPARHAGQHQTRKPEEE